MFAQNKLGSNSFMHDVAGGCVHVAHADASVAPNANATLMPATRASFENSFNAVFITTSCGGVMWSSYR
jgi:hypothetical protein